MQGATPAAIAAAIDEFALRQKALPLFFADRTRTLLGLELERLAGVLTDLDLQLLATQKTVDRLRETETQLGHSNG